jgi:hypothetical protein
MKLQNPNQIIMDNFNLINNKLSFFINSDVNITTDKGDFRCEFQSILYFNKEWKLDFYELVDITSIKLGNDNITKLDEIKEYMAFLEKITGNSYWGQLSDISEEYIDKIINKQLSLLNLYFNEN